MVLREVQEQDMDDQKRKLPWEHERAEKVQDAYT